ncbi:MAG: bifunctional hydroxymethylpyrimidine kinase/phosphomethylpyrimidine kinase [Planctomycetota bacterium]|nr:MAG: bifunctional hydroxymethylpyrimidine kinase/phosphomethylpyrimidine kinase [Planctomycetota bacterium]
MNVTAMTIAGSDPSGGAGLQADLKTFQQFGVYGCSAVSLLTVQNTLGVEHVEVMDPELVVRQIRAIVSDLPMHAAKTGALGSEAVIRAVAKEAAGFDFPLIVDPVMVSKHGHPLLPEAAMAALREELLPKAFLITPNRHEAAALLGRKLEGAADLRQAVLELTELGPEHVLLKGGREGDENVDLLCHQGECLEFRAAHFDTPHLHGSGCVLAAAITAELARGQTLRSAIHHAKSFVTQAMVHGRALGRGMQPLNLFVPPHPHPHN